MKKLCCLWLFLFWLVRIPSAYSQDTVVGSNWSHNLLTSCYIMKDNFIFMPVYNADKDWLHLEARYDYEDMNTLSAWFGYNFIGGNKFRYTITPIAGLVIGNTTGVAPGLKFDLEYYGIELYSESEFVFNFKGIDNSFYYNWTDLTYAPIDWLWFGLSIQRTKLYQNNLYLQSGLMVGGGDNCVNIEGYLYNPWTDNIYFILAMSLTLPE